MAACPWCKAEIRDARAACPRCGRRADDAGVVGGTGSPGDVPDLDIPARPSKGGSVARVAAAPRVPAEVPAKSTVAIHGAADDPGARNFESDEGDFGGGAPLDLDLSHGPPMISAQPSAAKIPVALPGGGAVKEGSTLASASVPPAGSSGAPAAMARSAEPAIDPYEARALSDYGDPPREWWRAPMYAFHVLRRRPELKKRAAAKRREADRARGAAEDALVAFGEVVRSDAQKLAAFAPLFAEVRAAEQVVRERDAVLAAEADAHKARQAQHDARLAELEAELAQIQVEERQVAGELGEADALAKRAEARVKRAEIEMRNAIAQSGGEGSGEAKGPV